MLHFIFFTRLKKRILEGMLADRIKELFFDCADSNRWTINEIDIQPDYLYMTIEHDSNVSIDKMVKFFRKSTHILYQEFPDLGEFQYGKNFWYDGYFAAISTVYTDEMRKDYLRQVNEIQ